MSKKKPVATIIREVLQIDRGTTHMWTDTYPSGVSRVKMESGCWVDGRWHSTDGPYVQSKLPELRQALVAAGHEHVEVRALVGGPASSGRLTVHF